MKTVIFACVHNAGRSQMAAAFFNELADRSKAKAVSAGAEPGVRVHPEVLVAMQELGIDLSNAKPLKLTEELAKGASLLITMGCGDKRPYVQDCDATTGRCVIRRVADERCAADPRRHQRTGASSDAKRISQLLINSRLTTVIRPGKVASGCIG